MNVLAIYGNPRTGGFVHGAVEALARRLEDRGAAVERLPLAEADLRHCTGCFTCLRTGECVLDDEGNAICEKMRQADAFVIGCSVRNGSVTALYKTFYERITYPLIFTGDLTGKYVLSLAAVGKMGGRRATARYLGLKGTGAYPVRHLFFTADIPTGLSTEGQAVAARLDAAADRLVRRVETGWRPGPLFALGRRLDRLVMGRLLFAKNPDLYAHVIACYRRRGWMP